MFTVKAVCKVAYYCSNGRNANEKMEGRTTQCKDLHLHNLICKVCKLSQTSCVIRVQGSASGLLVLCRNLERRSQTLFINYEKNTTKLVVFVQLYSTFPFVCYFVCFRRHLHLIASKHTYVIDHQDQFGGTE